MRKNYLSLLCAVLMICSSTTATFGSSQAKIEFKMESQFKTKEHKIKNIKDMEKEAIEIKQQREYREKLIREEQERLLQEEIKRKEQEEQKKREMNNREFVLTFYSGDSSENSQAGAVTCTGQPLREGIVANNVLPLGTKIFLEGYGEVIVADHGGSQFNSEERLDVFISGSKSEVNKMGRQIVKGRIINEN